MTQELVPASSAGPLAVFADRLPPMIAGADNRTAWRFVDFFAVTIRNPNTREATTARCRGSWTGASSAVSTASTPSCRSTSRPTSSSSPSPGPRVKTAPLGD